MVVILQRSIWDFTIDFDWFITLILYLSFCLLFCILLPIQFLADHQLVKKGQTILQIIDYDFNCCDNTTKHQLGCTWLELSRSRRVWFFWYELSVQKGIEDVVVGLIRFKFLKTINVISKGKERPWFSCMCCKLSYVCNFYKFILKSYKLIWEENYFMGKLNFQRILHHCIITLLTIYCNGFMLIFEEL